MKNFLVLLFLIPIPFSPAWIKIFGGEDDEYAYFVQQTTDEGYIIVGGTNSFGIGDYDVLLIKTDKNGDTLWTKTFGGEYYDVGFSVQQTSDDGYIIIGDIDTSGTGDNDIYLIKTDIYGDTIWTKIFGGNKVDAGRSVQQTSDGGYIITGSTYSFGGGSSKAYLIKTDFYGDTLWTKLLDGKIGFSVSQTSDGGYILTGGGDNYFFYNFYLAKTDSCGNTQWSKTFGGAYRDCGFSVQQTTDGGYIFSGIISFTNFHHAGYLIKTDSYGDTLWTKIFEGTNSASAISVQQTTDDGYIIAGYTGNYSDNEWDLYLIKTDNMGDTLWTKIIECEKSSYGLSVQQTTDEGYIITGETGAPYMHKNDVLLIKTDKFGNISNPLGIQAFTPNSNRTLLKTIDYLGRDIKQPQPNQPYIEIYDDGSKEKKMILE